ncbi:relaxase/mobilization nuclease domain-containing protein [Desulfovibrio sp. OttesenSCG-928-I05]|nr:relaxase/mobilization nuclease domain-containing protein [Desulfovibrio sp. OttesenSCG-928-I05]
MISRHIPIEPANDNYGRLAKYLARLDEYADEKEIPLMAWCAGCIGGDDYLEGIAEATDTQALNTRSKANPTYHLVISFRPEDEAKLTPVILKDIEQRFAEVLGLSEHQRHCAVHNDTANLHLQIAYNLIHPVTHNRNYHSHDHTKRDRLCRQLEKEYGLTVDNGMESKGQAKGNAKAKAVELQQGIESFDTYAKQYKEQIAQALDAAEGWQDLHKEFAKYGLVIKPQNNGLAIKNMHGKHGMKASELDRRLSKKSLEKRFGAYAAPEKADAREVNRYRGKPVQRSPAQEALWAEYEQEAAARAAAAEIAKQQQRQSIEEIRAKWARKRAELDKLTIHKRNRQNLIRIAKKKEAAEIAAAKAENQKGQDALYSKASKYSWNDFLRERAEDGDEKALAVLRSRKKAVVPEAAPAIDEQRQVKARPDYAALAALKAEAAEQQARIVESDELTRKGKRQLQAFLRMDELTQEEKLRGSAVPYLDGITRRVDNKGAVIFILPTGGRILDTGNEVYSSGNDEAAQKIAQLYAQKKWGNRVKADKGRLIFDQEREAERPSPQRKKKELSR